MIFMNNDELYLKMLDLVKHSPAGSYCRTATDLRVAPNVTKTFEIFHYHYTMPYAEWNAKPESYECRGSVFVDGKFVSRPMAKFFNMGEDNCPLTTAYLHDNVIYAMDKMDGSLISSVVLKNIEGSNKDWILKSFRSFESDVAIKATKFINRKENKRIRNFVSECAAKNWTVNFEYTAPDNQIVIEYPEEKLTILNVRDIETGEYVYIKDHPEEMDPYWVKDRTDLILSHTFDELVNMKGVEGWVLIFKDQTLWKFKTKWYLELHHTLDPILSNNNNALVRVILSGDVDDLRNLAAGSNNFKYQLQKVDDFEKHIRNFISETVNRIQTFYNKNRGLTIKQLAIKAKKDKSLESYEFPQVMNLKRKGKINYDMMIEGLLTHHKHKFIPDKYRVLTIEK